MNGTFTSGGLQLARYLAKPAGRTDALPGLIETSLKARARTDKPSNDDNHRLASWRVGAGNGDTLEMSVWRTPPHRASININYVARKR